MPVKKKDTDRALALLEDYCKKLKKPEEQQLKKAIKKVMGIFKSSLFQALLVFLNSVNSTAGMCQRGQINENENYCDFLTYTGDWTISLNIQAVHCRKPPNSEPQTSLKKEKQGIYYSAAFSSSTTFLGGFLET
ncbi:Disks large-like 1, partial [Ophiophagus hannah]